MATESIATDPYEAVLADLRARREKIDQTIELLTSMRAGGHAAPGASLVRAPESEIVETAGMYLGMSIVDAAKKLLAMRKRTMGNAEILAELQSGGLVLTGADPLNVVGSVLTRRFNNQGDVVRVGRGIWGLKEWYPGRTFKTTPKGTMAAEAAGTESGASDSSEPEGVVYRSSPMTSPEASNPAEAAAATRHF